MNLWVTVNRRGYCLSNLQLSSGERLCTTIWDVPYEDYEEPLNLLPPFARQEGAIGLVTIKSSSGLPTYYLTDPEVPDGPLCGPFSR